MINNKLTADSPYYHHLRHSLLKLARGNPIKVIEIGCAAGQSLVYFKSRGTQYVVGVELVPEVAEIARQRIEIDQVITGNVEDIDLPFPTNYFDLMIAGHVLEHVTDPWTILAKLKKYLRPGGQLIGSLPNVRYVGVSVPLLIKGKWDYVPEGILDWTHYRFFTRNTVQSLLTATGFSIDSITPELAGRKANIVNSMTFGLFRDLLGFTNNFSATLL